jgi:hypothetical protein
MKTLALAAVAATMAAGTAFAHPINEPHVCDIDPSTVMDWPASNWVPENTGQVYDRGAYFFIATNDQEGGMNEYTTTHTRIWKDTCAVTGIDIFHSQSDPVVGEVEEESNEDTGTDTGTDTDAGEDTGTDAGEDTGTDAGEDTGTDAGEDKFEDKEINL